MITREYLRKLIMETIYVSPGGQAMKRKEFDTLRSADLRDIQADEPSKTYETGSSFVRAAKKEYDSLDPSDLQELQTIFTMANLGDASKLRWDGSSVDVSMLEGNEESFEHAKLLGESLFPDIFDYLNSLINFKRLPEPTSDDRDKQLLATFFSPVASGAVGMGSSLMIAVINTLADSMLSVKSMTPLEFQKRYYPTFKKIVDRQFSKIFSNAGLGNRSALEDVKRGYLEAINYVLKELMAEANFEGIYVDESDEPLFMPDDPAVWEKIKRGDPGAQAAAIQYGYTPRERSDRENLVEGVWAFRDDPAYYATRFSFNPAYKGGTTYMFDERGKYIRQQVHIDSKRTLTNLFDHRMFSQTYLGLGTYYGEDGLKGGLVQNGLDNHYEES